MAETIVSPGVLTIENDQSFITQQPIQAGAAIIGPAVKGPVEIPTMVTSYSDYTNKFGTTFTSGSQVYTYLTSISAYNYFNSGGTSLLVTRVTSGSFTPATSSLIPTSTAFTSASAVLDLTFISESVSLNSSGLFEVNGIVFYFTGSNETNTTNTIYINTASFAADTISDYTFTASAIFNVSNSISPYDSSLQNILTTDNDPNITFTYIGSNGLTGNSQYYISGSTTTYFSGGTNTEAFILETLSEGIIMNSESTLNTDGSLPSGSSDNIRWQVVSPNIDEGTFTLVVRRGDDDSIQPSLLETWNNLSLDPFSPTYIEKVIGNQTQTVNQDGTDYYIGVEGNYSNQSQFLRVKQVNITTPNYLDNSGDPKNEYTASIPIVASGSFGGAEGSNVPVTEGKYYENITNASIQGLVAGDYTQAIALLSNKAEFKYNFITAPGLIHDFAAHIAELTSLLSNCQQRGDTLAIIDLLDYNANILEVTNEASSINNSYATSYWPWLQTLDPNSGQQVWTPASTLIPSVYAFNDASSEVWNAPAGNNRGVMSTVTKAERKLTQGNRDALYSANVNPITTQTGVGVVVFGQKTLQKKKSALDRVGVRRLLIELKSTIGQMADNLVFEQNTVTTRNTFLSQVNPYLSSIQQRDGLYSYQVVMDESNNTSTVIDNNQLIGQIFIQPTKTAEFIILDFNILPSGATLT